MSVRLKLVLVAAVAAFSMAAFASSASADVYCVHVTTCTYGGEAGTEIAGFDEIPFWEFTTGSGPHALVLGDDGGPIDGTVGFVSSTEQFDVVAEPGSHPVVNHTGNSLSTVSINAPNCTVSGIQIEVPNLVNGRALQTNCAVSDVKLVGVTSAVQTYGLYFNGDDDVSINNLDVDWDAAGEGTAVEITGTAELEILDAYIEGDILTGISAQSASAEVSLRRSTIHTSGPAIQNGGAASRFEAYDVVAQSADQPQGTPVVSLTNGATFIGNHMTIVGSGGQYRFGLLARANSGVLNAQLDNSIIASTGTAFDYAIFGEETGTSPFAGVQTNNSIVPNKFGIHVATNTPVTPGSGEPKFVGPNDFRLKPNQVAIDKSAGPETDTVDAFGQGRPVDGDDDGTATSDLGALEYQRRAPEAHVDGPVTLAPGQTGDFDAESTFDADGDDMTYEWDFGDGSPVDTSGDLIVHHAYAAGKFILKFTATDEAGESDIVTLDIDVPAPFVPPVNNPITPGPVADTTAPNVSIGKITANKAGTKLSTKVTCPATETTCKFTLSYSAKAGKTGSAKKYAKDVTTTVAGGKSATLTIKLNSAALKLIKSKGKVKGTFILLATDGNNNSTTRTVLYSAKQGKTGSAK